MKSPLLKPAPESTTSSIAIGGHPLHPMLITFPIAFLSGALGSDLAYWWSGDPFWARASLWLVGSGLAMGLLAALAGMLDFMLIKEIRRHVTSWSHFLIAIMLLSLAATNWWLRIDDPAREILPWGIYLSAVSTVALAVAGWLGGKLVFEHNIGSGEPEPDDGKEGEVL